MGMARRVSIRACLHQSRAGWICRRPVYRSPRTRGGRGPGAADMTAQFKEIEEEMQAEGEQSRLYVLLGRAWENSAAPAAPTPVPACGYRQGGKWTYRCCIVPLQNV